MPATILSPSLRPLSDLEVLLAGDPYFYGPEGHFVVRADDEHAFDVLLADFLLRLRLAEADRRVPLRERLVLAHGERDDRNRQHAACACR